MDSLRVGQNSLFFNLVNDLSHPVELGYKIHPLVLKQVSHLLLYEFHSFLHLSLAVQIEVFQPLLEGTIHCLQ